jgi:histidinol-phosphate aminotransferase
LFAALRGRGIIVRYFDKPRIDEHLRISIGTDEQCDELLGVLGELLAQCSADSDLP